MNILARAVTLTIIELKRFGPRYCQVVHVSLTTALHTFIWVGTEEYGVVGTVATLQSRCHHGAERIDGIDEPLIVPADTTAYEMRATLQLLRTPGPVWIREWMKMYWVTVPGFTGWLHHRTTGLVHFRVCTFVFYSEVKREWTQCFFVFVLRTWLLLTLINVLINVFVPYHRVHRWHSSSQCTCQLERRRQHMFVSWCNQS